MNLERWSGCAAMVGSYRFTDAPTNAPGFSAAKRRCKSERREGRRVVVHFLEQIFWIDSRRQSLREADVYIRPIRQHCFHRPLPEIMATLVLRSLEMDFYWMK